MPGLGIVDQAYYLNHDASRSAVGARFVPEDFQQSDFEVGYQRRNTQSEFFYALNNSLNVVTKDGQTSVSPGSSRGAQGAAAVVVNIVGNTFGKFEVVVNDRVAGVAWAHQQNVVSLRPYETYRVRVRVRVRIRAVGYKIIGTDETVHTVTLYPGNVATLEFAVKELTVLVGQAVYEDGSPVKHARFANVEGYGATYGLGWFQIEVADRSPKVLRPRGALPCEVTLPEFYTDDGLAVLDTVVCKRETTESGITIIPVPR